MDYTLTIAQLREGKQYISASNVKVRVTKRGYLEADLGAGWQAMPFTVGWMTQKFCEASKDLDIDSLKVGDVLVFCGRKREVLALKQDKVITWEESTGATGCFKEEQLSDWRVEGKV